MLTLARVSLAQSPADLEQAKRLFQAGAQAYGAGQFLAAIQAFDAASKLAPRPAILFSSAQAHRRQYFLDKNPAHLQTAVTLYRRYVAEVAEGGRRGDAAVALGELEPLLAKVGDEAAPAKTSVKEPARIMIMTPPEAEGARAAIDGEAPKSAPLAVEVTPGKHHVKVTAPGFRDYEKDVIAVENALVPVDAALEERPARLVIDGVGGAQVSIDGRVAAVLPLASPLEVPSGTHLVTVSRTGHEPISREIEVARDETRRVDAHLRVTGQRIVAWSLLGVGAAGLVTGAVGAGLTLKGEADASQVLDRRQREVITEADAQSYDEARSRRGDWATVTTVAFGLSAAALATGGLLYFFDSPSPNVTTRRDERKRTPSPAPAPMQELGMTPVTGPGTLGLNVVGRF